MEMCCLYSMCFWGHRRVFCVIAACSSWLHVYFCFHIPGIVIYIYTCIYGEHKKKCQLCASSSNGNCNRLTHLKIWTTQEKMQLCASSNGKCNRSTDLNFRSRASRGVLRQQVHVRILNQRGNIYIHMYLW